MNDTKTNTQTNTQIQIIKSDYFNNIQCDFYSNENNDIFMTSEQLGNALGYSVPRESINKIVNRNKYLGSIEFSDEVKLTSTDGKLYKTRVFTEDGIYEVCMLSDAKNAKEFRSWVRIILKNIRKHGMYATEELLDNPDLLIKVATKLKEEKEARKLAEQNLQIAEQELINKDQQIIEMKPNANLGKAITISEDSILIGDLAKLLKQKGIKTGSVRLFQAMRDNGYLGTYGNNYNIPTQKSMELELFELRENVIETQYGTSKISFTPMVTGKGQQYFINKILKDQFK
jgi:anti-repressor protein